MTRKPTSAAMRAESRTIGAPHDMSAPGKKARGAEIPLGPPGPAILAITSRSLCSSCARRIGLNRQTCGKPQRVGSEFGFQRMRLTKPADGVYFGLENTMTSCFRPTSKKRSKFTSRARQTARLRSRYGVSLLVPVSRVGSEIWLNKSPDG